MKRTPLRRVSPKRQLVNAERREFVREQLRLRPNCEAGIILSPTQRCTRTATELHEPKTRARYPGKETILSAENSVAICRFCHTWVHSNPAAAEELGLLVPSGEP